MGWGTLVGANDAWAAVQAGRQSAEYGSQKTSFVPGVSKSTIAWNMGLSPEDRMRFMGQSTGQPTGQPAASPYATTAPPAPTGSPNPGPIPAPGAPASTPTPTPQLPAMGGSLNFGGLGAPEAAGYAALKAPSAINPNLGQRNPPQAGQALAALRRIF